MQLMKKKYRKQIEDLELSHHELEQINGEINRKLNLINSKIEKKETKELEQTIITDKEEVLEICYETSRRIVSQTEYFVTVEITYTCYNHPEFPGKGTVYINN